jgi:hypothetical protein
MFKLFILLPLFLLYPFLSSQNLVDLYQEYLPDYVRYDEKINTMINGQLVAKASVHPDMIYFHIERIHLQLIASDNAMRLRRLSLIEAIEKRYIRRRTEWAFEQIDQLKNSNYHRDIQDLSLPYFERFLVDTKESAISYAESDLTIDLSKKEYFTYIYYMKKRMQYNPTINYKNKCKHFES